MSRCWTSPLLALLPLVPLLLGSWGCKDATLADGAANVACVLPLTRASCVKLPASWSEDLEQGTTALDDCFLFQQPDGGAEAYRSSWEELDTAGLPSACDSDGTPLRRPIASPFFESGPPILVCNPPRGKGCETDDGLQGSLVRCRYKQGGISLNLGPGVSAASLGSDGRNLAAAWLSEADEGGQSGRLRWQLFDGEARQVEIPASRAHEEECPGVSNARSVNGARLWAPPRVSSDGQVDLFAVGVCAYTLAAAGTPTLQRVTFSADGARSTPVCIDVGGRVSGLSWGHASTTASDDDVWVAMSVDCEQGEGLFGARCPGNGLLVRPADTFTPAGICDDDQQPLVEAPAAESVPWIDGALLDFEADPRSGLDGTGHVAAAVHVGQSTPVQVIARLYQHAQGDGPMQTLDMDVLGAATASLQSLHTRQHYLPAIAQAQNAVVLAFAEPAAGLVVSQLVYRSDRADLPPRWQHLERVVLAGAEPQFAPAPTLDGEVLQPQVAVDPGLPTRGYAACYVSSVDAAVPELRNVTLVQVRGPDIDFTNTAVVGSNVACAVAPGVEGSGERYKVLITDSVRRILLTVPDVGDGVVVPTATYPDLSGFPGVVRSLQMRAFGGSYYALVEYVSKGTASSYQVYQVADGPPQARVIAEVPDVAATDRPHLQADASGLFVSYVATRATGTGLRRLRVLPTEETTDMALSLQPSRGAILGAADDRPALVYSGPYLMPRPTAAGEGAWVRLGGPEEPPRRLTRRMPRDAAQPQVLASSDGEPQVLYAGDGLVSSHLPSSVERFPVVGNLARRGDLTGLAVSRVESTDGRPYGLVLYTTAEKVYLNAFRLDETTSTFEDEGREIDLFGNKSLGGPTAPALVPLAPGVVGISICHDHGDGRRVRVLAPVDFGGQLLGPPFDFGLQVKKGMTTCPPATLLDHGGRLVSSFIENEETRIAELECVEEVSP